MKKDIHPEYREVLFHDTSVDEYFLVSSTLNTDQTKEWTDGKTYPYCVLDISSASHPFYTGKQKFVNEGGRVDKFKKRFGDRKKVVAAVEETPVEEVTAAEVVAEETTEAPVEEVTAEVVAEETAEAPIEEVAAEEAVAEESPAEEENTADEANVEDAPNEQDSSEDK
jgi:large subunit ribosomal protein L31